MILYLDTSRWRWGFFADHTY